MPRGRSRNVNLVMPEVPNNPQVQGPRIEMEFMCHNPPTFNREGDPLTAERWIRALEKIFGFLQCTNKEMVTCGLYQLVDDADFWWESIRRTISEADWELFTWEDFKIIMYQKYIPAHYQHQKVNEFWNLKQGNKSIADYDLQFNRLSRYTPQTVDTEEKRIEKFHMGLKPEIGTALIGKDDTSYGQILGWALSIEAMQGTSKTSASQPAVGDQKGKRKWEGPQQGYPGKNFQHNYQGGRNFGTRPAGQGNVAPKSQGYQGNSPQCAICSRHHFGPCVQCYRCGRQGHYANVCSQNSGMQGQQQQQTMRNVGPQGGGGRGNNNNNRGNPRPQQNKNQGPRAPQQARAYALNQQEAAGNPGNLADACKRLNLELELAKEALAVSIPSGRTLLADCVCKNLDLVVSENNFTTDLYALEMRDFDIIFGMDWLTKEGATIRCHEREIIFQKLSEKEVKFYGAKLGNVIPIISALKAVKLLQKGDCQAFLVNLSSKKEEGLTVDQVYRQIDK
ncbi:hypothetical protein C2S52_001298 [Perilla frutescens var. hirtella]|nr:hypothetical protein C2S52_001298 [Perilla frutescens var. hirtella]